VNSIARHAQGIGVIIGSPVPNPEKAGKDLFNIRIEIYWFQVHINF